MKTDKQSLYRPHSPAPADDMFRRRFIKQSFALAAASPMATELSPALAAGSQLSAARSHLAANTLGFNGERQDPATGLYPLGKGYRIYNPAMMRFHASDSMSPFGQGG